MVGCLLFVVFVSDVLFLDVLFDSGWCSVTPIVTCHLITGCTSEFHFCSQPQNPRVICSLQTKARVIYSCLKKQVSTIQSFPANLGEAELRAGQLALARRRGGKVQRSRPGLRQPLRWVHPQAQVHFLAQIHLLDLYKLPFSCPNTNNIPWPLKFAHLQTLRGLRPWVSCPAGTYSEVPPYSGVLFEEMQLTGEKSVVRPTACWFLLAILINTPSLDLGQFVISHSQVEYNIKKEVEEAVVSSVQDWYNFILDKMPIESNRAMRVKNLTNLTNILGQDLREGCNASHDQFQASLNVNYKQLCFRQCLMTWMMVSFRCLQRAFFLTQICTEESFDFS